MNHLSVSKDMDICLSVRPPQVGFCYGCYANRRGILPDSSLCDCLHDIDDPEDEYYISGENYYIWKKLVPVNV